MGVNLSTVKTPMCLPLPEVPIKPASKVIVFWSRTSCPSGVGEEVKLHELQYETKWSVLGREGVGPG